MRIVNRKIDIDEKPVLKRFKPLLLTDGMSLSKKNVMRLTDTEVRKIDISTYLYIVLCIAIYTLSYL